MAEEVKTEVKEEIKEESEPSLKTDKDNQEVKKEVKTEAKNEVKKELPSDSVIKSDIIKLVRGANLAEVTVKQLRRQLEAKYGASLNEKKDFVREEVTAAVDTIHKEQQKKETSSTAADGDEDEESDNFDDDDDDGELEEAPKKKRKTSTKPRKQQAEDTKPWLSLQMEAVAGKPRATRFELVKLIWQYVRANDLKDGKTLICDDNLKACFNKKTMDAFSMARYLSQHMFKKDDERVDPNDPESRRITVVEPPPKEKKEKASPRKRKAPAAKGAKKERKPIAEESKPFVSSQLAAVIGKPRATRFEVVKLIWQYVKENDLKDGRNIKCDENLKGVFEVDQVGAFAMNKYISQHMFTKDDPLGSHAIKVVQPAPGAKPKTKKKKDSFIVESDEEEEEEEEDDESVPYMEEDE